MFRPVRIFVIGDSWILWLFKCVLDEEILSGFWSGNNRAHSLKQQKVLAQRRSQQQKKKIQITVSTKKKNKTTTMVKRRTETLWSDEGKKTRSFQESETGPNESYWSVYLPICNISSLIHSSTDLAPDKNQYASTYWLHAQKCLSEKIKRKDQIPPPNWCIHEVPCQRTEKRLSHYCDGWHGHVFI